MSVRDVLEYYLDRIVETNERLLRAKKGYTRHLYGSQLGGYVTQYKRWLYYAEEELPEREIREFEEIVPEVIEEIEREKVLYKSWVITFETRAGTTKKGHSFIATNVEVWIETVNYESRIPSDSWVKETVLNSIARDIDWSWILFMGMKWGVEETQETAEEAIYDHLSVIIYRTTDYEVEDNWQIPY